MQAPYFPHTDPPRWVPVVSSAGKVLMPCHPARARKLVAKGKAITRWRRGIFYIALTQREDGEVQPVCIGVDPGSKREGYTVMSAKRTFVNILADAVDGKTIQRALKTRANARRARRGRNTPCRPPRFNNRSRAGWIPPSTKARWQLKLNVILQLSKLYPITQVAIEDVKAEMKKGARRWNTSFSPVQAGKNWLYSRLAPYYEVRRFMGMQTYQLRQSLGLLKSRDKMANAFEAHCVDSWVIANAMTGNRVVPDLRDMLTLKPRRFCRRHLHLFNPKKGGARMRYGSSMSLGIQKGTLAIHPKHGKCVIGGNDGVSKLNLHSCESYVKLSHHGKREDLKLIAYSPWVVTDLTTALKGSKRARRLIRRNTKILRLENVKRILS